MGREDRIVENGLGKRRREETRADGVGIDPMRRPGFSHCAGQLYNPAFAGSVSNAGDKTILFVPGWGMSSAVFEKQLEEFEGSDEY